MINEIKKNVGKLSGIYTEQIELKESFIDFASRFAEMTGTVILLSGLELDCSQHHILAAMPWLSLSCRSTSITVKTQDQAFAFEADPFDTLRQIINAFRPEIQNLPTPVFAGLFGYLSYDLKDRLERLPRTSVDDLCLPHYCLYAPSIIVVHNKAENSTRVFIPETQVKPALNRFRQIISSNLKTVDKILFYQSGEGFKSNFTRNSYMEALSRIHEYIASGHVYQVNMSQRFETDFSGNPYALFQQLYRLNPAPFFAYINAGDHHIVSTSPERFILQNKKQIQTRPIKGTRPRGKTPEQDQELMRALQESRKDDAELSMIVDLLRNDIGKICRAGSVIVKEHKRIEAYKNVWHLVSIIEGVLDDGCDSIDLIRATFPGGSITGCPKIRAMEIIDELEPSRRHIYTGSIGYISFHDTMDLSIAIRTATILNGKIFFSVGGGIVFDSDPSDEYDETLHKGQTLMAVFNNANKKPDNLQYVWINGLIQRLENTFINIDHPGFQYGYGYFETIRVVNNEPRYLNEHIDRFNLAWNYLFHQPNPDITWDEVIHQVIAANNLTNAVAAVKIIAAAGTRKNPPYNHTFIVTAKPYVHRLEGKEKQGLALATYPHARQTPLADYKTLNYLYYLKAGTWAEQNGADLALILNPDGTVSETNTANIIIVRDKIVILPVSQHVLQGITQKITCRLLESWGFKIEYRKLYPKDLFSAQAVLLTNALMGAVPALSLDKKSLKIDSDICNRINKQI